MLSDLQLSFGRLYNCVKNKESKTEQAKRDFMEELTKQTEKQIQERLRAHEEEAKACWLTSTIDVLKATTDTIIMRIREQLAVVHSLSAADIVSVNWETLAPDLYNPRCSHATRG